MSDGEADAADVLDYRAGGPPILAQIDYQFEGLDRTALFADRRFTVERIVATTKPAAIATDGRPLIIMSLEHALEIDCAAGGKALDPYRTVIVPAEARRCSVRSARPRAPFLFVTPARSRDRLAARLFVSGIPQPRIDAFNEQFL